MYTIILVYTIYQVPFQLPLPTFRSRLLGFGQDTQASATHATPIENTQLQFPCIVAPEIGLKNRGDRGSYDVCVCVCVCVCVFFQDLMCFFDLFWKVEGGHNGATTKICKKSLTTTLTCCSSFAHYFCSGSPSHGRIHSKQWWRSDIDSCHQFSEHKIPIATLIKVTGDQIKEHCPHSCWHGPRKRSRHHGGRST